MEGTTRTRVVVGSAFVPLKQFQSSFVVKLDVFAPLALSVNQAAPSTVTQLCNLKVGTPQRVAVVAVAVAAWGGLLVRAGCPL